jgi:hypothetical protein
MSTPWPAYRQNRLVELFGMGLTYDVIGARLGGITRSAVCMKASRIGLKRDGNGLKWSSADDETLRALWPTTLASEIGALIGRSKSAVIGRANRIGLAPKGNHKPARRQ